MGVLDVFFKSYEDKRNTDKVENLMRKAFEFEGNYAKITGLMKIFEKKGSLLERLSEYYFSVYKKNRHHIKIEKYDQSDEEVSYEIRIEVGRHDFLLVNLYIHKEKGQIKCSITIEKYNELDLESILEFLPHTEYPIYVVITEEEYKSVREEIRETENKILSAFGLN